MKKTHFLQTLYLQKPLLLIILVATLSTLPWIGMGDFYTKGEPREAVLAISMIEKGEWVIPSNYADEFAYKPPLMHWMIAGFSILFNDGEVTPFTSRLPSTLGFIAMIGVCFMFFARRRPLLEAFLSCLIVITCFEVHRSAMAARVDMLLTFFLVASVIQMVCWYESRKKRQIVSTWLLLTGAILVKGPVGFVLPCMIFGTYLLLQKENFFKATGKCLMLALPALIVPAMWYYAAYEIKGDDFLMKVFGENIGRFLSIDTKSLGIDYNLGVENPWYYYPITLITGYLPWTILLVISLFVIKYKKLEGGIKSNCVNLWNKIMTMEKVSQFSLVLIVISLLFFTVPSSKRSTYIMLIYPFLGLFIARFFIYLSEFKPKTVRISTSILAGIGVLTLMIVGLAYTGVINIEELSHSFTRRERTLNDIKVFSDLFINPGYWGLFACIVLLLTIANAIYLLRKKINVKVLVVGFAMMFSINIFMDSFLLPHFKDSFSSRPFAEYLSTKYDLKDNIYVTNNLLKYRNIYGLNFCFKNTFQNVEKKLPEEGYFLVLGDSSDPTVREDLGHIYEFTLLETSDRFNEYKKNIFFYRIEKKTNELHEN